MVTGRHWHGPRLIGKKGSACLFYACAIIAFEPVPESSDNLINSWFGPQVLENIFSLHAIYFGFLGMQ